MAAVLNREGRNMKRWYRKDRFAVILAESMGCMVPNSANTESL
jgi:hypothetical protein